MAGSTTKTLSLICNYSTFQNATHIPIVDVGNAI
jgi:hypothetical protein